MAHDVFISYSSHDKNIADAVCAALENNRIRCWIAPRDVLPGKEWGEAIVDAIGASKVMVLIFSSASNKSQQVLREVERAVNKNVIIVPFRIEDVLPTKSMEYFLYSTHWLDALTAAVEDHIMSLVDITEKLLNTNETRETTSKPFTPRPEVKKIRKSSKLALWIPLGILLAGFGIYGMVTAFTKPNNNIAVNQPVVSASPSADLVQPQEPSGEIENTATPAEESSPAIGHEATEAPVKDAGTSVNNAPDQEAAPPKPSSSESDAAAPQAPVAESKIQLKVGQVIQFGSYYGKPVNWTVIHVNNEGQPLLLTSEIVTLKPFDASESGTYNKMGETTFDNKMPKSDVYVNYSQEAMRAMKGSNNWANSNIREWLNSDQKPVQFTTQPPNASAVWYGYNDYDKEGGFLYNFTDAEKAMLKKVKHKSVASVMEKDKAVGGSALYNFSRASLDDALFNIDQAYYTHVEDRVFLLSVDEVIGYIYDKGQLLNAYLTEEAKTRDESSWYNDLKNQAGGSFMWWLRTPNANTSCEVLIVATTGDIIYSDYAVLCGVGVRPACYLNQSEFDLAGSGTKEDPFTLK